MADEQHELGKLANEAVIHVYLSRKNLAKMQKQSNNHTMPDVVTRAELDEFKRELSLRKDLGKLKKRIVREIDKCTVTTMTHTTDDESSLTSTPVVEEVLKHKNKKSLKVSKQDDDKSEDEPIHEVITEETSNELNVPEGDVEEDEKTTVTVNDVPQVAIDPFVKLQSDAQQTIIQTNKQLPEPPKKQIVDNVVEPLIEQPTDSVVNSVVQQVDKLIEQPSEVKEIPEVVASDVKDLPSVISPAVLPIENVIKQNNDIPTQPVINVPIKPTPSYTERDKRPTDDIYILTDSLTDDPFSQSLQPRSVSQRIHKLLDMVAKRATCWGVESSEELIIKNSAEYEVIRKYREMLNVNNDVIMSTFVTQIDRKIDDIKKSKTEISKCTNIPVENSQPLQVVPKIVPIPVDIVSQPVSDIISSVKKGNKKRGSLVMLFKKKKTID